MAEYINKTDTLNEGRVKLNEAISDSNDAKATSEQADVKATQALANSESTQTQLDTIVIDGDSSVEAAQARVDEKGDSHNTLKDRIDDGFTKTNAQLADIVNINNYELNSKNRRQQGITVFTTDDSRGADYTAYNDIFEPEGVPIVIYAVSDSIDKDGFLSKEQGLELQGKGCEIGSHSKSHPAPFPNVSDEQAEIEFRDSKRELESMGFVINNFSYVGGNYGKRERLLARKYYRSARCSDRDFKGTNAPPLNTYELKTIWVDPKASPLSGYLRDYDRPTAIQKIIDYAKETIDYARDNNAIAVISTHFINIYAPDLEDAYRTIVQYSKSQTLVTTMNDALNIMGNVVDVGDYSQTNERAQSGSYFIVGSGGETLMSDSVLDEDKFTPLTTPSEFPSNTSVLRVTSNNDGISAAPEGLSGTLITFKPTRGAETPRYVQQRYIIAQVGAEFSREGVVNGWTEWKRDVKTFYEDNFTPRNLFGDFSVGITYTLVKSNNPDISYAPNGRAGTMITHSVIKGSSAGYNYQKYILFNSNISYTRQPRENGDWNPWELDNDILLPDQNENTLNDGIGSFEKGTTYTIVPSDDPHIDKSPNGERGRLITTKLTSIGQLAYSFQKYIDINGNESYRRPLNESEWSSWV